ncbi:MAG: mechanosensitive ion channel domain-containing protein [Bacteroides sp.]|jgi:small-conductance mechanosensitive channel|nr:mechanosensitive ion channel domain-containing protein [Bacteroides sp.]
MNTFLEDLRQEIIQYYDGLVAITPKLLIALFVLLVTWFLARQIRNFSDRKLRREMEDPLLAAFLATFFRTIILIIGFLIVLRILGFGGFLTSMLAGAGITAFIIGFALRDIGENFLAGIIMAFKRPFRVGDYVESGSIRGVVVGLNIRDTRLKTPDGKDVYIPNAMIIKNPLINFTIDGFLRFDFIITLPAKSDYEKQLALIEETVNKVKGVLKERKKTIVSVSSVYPYKVEVNVSYWIDTFSDEISSEIIRSEVMLSVQNALEKYQETLP